MSVPLFVSERSKPKITTKPLSVGCLIFERMDQIDFTGPFEQLSDDFARSGLNAWLIADRRPGIHWLRKTDRIKTLFST
jgi:hypothetical protein